MDVHKEAMVIAVLYGSGKLGEIAMLRQSSGPLPTEVRILGE
jgi:hypothetical protein